MQHQHQAFEQIFVVKNLSLMREMYMRTNSTRMGIKALNNGVNPFTHFFISNPNACLQRDLHPMPYVTDSTHLPLDKMMTAISRTTFANEFSWMKNFEFWLRFRWNLFLMVQLKITQHWFRFLMAWRRIGDKPLSEPMLTWLTDACMRHWRRWVNELSNYIF